MKVVSALFIFQVFTSGVFSQPVDEIINRHAAAMGGYNKLNTVESVKLTGKFSSDTSVVPFTIIIKGKNKIKMVLTIKGKDIVQVYNGTAGWFLNPYNGGKKAELMDDEDIKEIKKTLEWEGQLVNYKVKGSKAELMDSDSGNYKIKLINKDKDTVFYYVDASSYLVTRQSTTIKTAVKEITEDIFFYNYYPVEGIMFAATAQTKVINQQKVSSVVSCVFDKIELNTSVEDSIFEAP